MFVIALLKLPQIIASGAKAHFVGLLNVGAKAPTAKELFSAQANAHAT
jgi:hypothetical protein